MEPGMKSRGIVRILSGRSSVYSVLGRAYEREVDLETLSMYSGIVNGFLRKYVQEVDVNADIREGVMELYNIFKNMSNDGLRALELDLAVDYADMFLGVKYAREGRGIPHPSESVYIRGRMYEITDQISSIYMNAGFLKSPEFREPDDHIALELYFIAHLSRKAAESFEADDAGAATKYLGMQREFALDHLLRWGIRLADDVTENAGTDFYRAIGKMTRGVLSSEEEFIDGLIARAP